MTQSASSGAALLDANLLIALAWPQHIHHAAAHAWFGSAGKHPWATCALTQLAFLRISSNPKIISGAVSPRNATLHLQRIVSLPNHVFWNCDLAPSALPLFQSVTLSGHRQVTDAYLLALAQHHGGRLATLDKGIAQLLSSALERDQLIDQVTN
ncbi:PIN domain-containing protein [Oleomonas cavernae]|uniref:Ribonuclease VapC n=1 Tax=Oleomonas cavernae TaxID=2320859 RepID=A0A418WGV8_9PROT|nr:TA system VapC family ribonuclease toxin [Oleomonas cavernae]RJF89099.1 PIN domain-containing protein [Oleomonas cavernae]